MARISDAARGLYWSEMAAAAVTEVAEQRWHHLERAHNVSQPDPWLHTANHVAMFRFAVRQHVGAKLSGRSCASSCWNPPRSTTSKRR
ncbi:hypothetical protein ABID74_001850 [Gordonia terrae]